MTHEARLVLEDGTVFEGQGFGQAGAVAGEVVFNTGMTGYPEALTDPSYRGQILTLTYPLVGNYGVPALARDEAGLPLGFESERIQVAALIVGEHSAAYSHHTAARSLDRWLADEGVPAISGIDTRALTMRLREQGTMLGKVEDLAHETGFQDPNALALAAEASCADVSTLNGVGGDAGRRPRVIVVDCGCKSSIMRSLLVRGIDVLRVPHDHYFLSEEFDGLVISSGPGDPQLCTATIRNVERALAVGKPILGICLGHQILGLAVGAETYKLKFGHRSQNQPCVEVAADPGGEPAGRRCYITSQNHGFAVRRERLPGDWRVWFENANDGTVEGIRHNSKPFLGVQFHPEASPGPEDTAWIFDEYAELVQGGAR